MINLKELKALIRNSLSKENQNKIKKYSYPILTYFSRKDLKKLATIWGTDKWNDHWYVQHYQNHFDYLRDEKINLLEIGVGGYDDFKTGGESLRMWKSFFRKANIFSLDIHDKSSLEEERIKIFQGNQTDEIFLKDVVDKTGGFDVIIDDGSHVNEHVIKSFEILFPLLNNNGWYVVEDMQTSYWLDYGGDSDNLEKADTSINYFKKMVHCLNYQELIRPGYQPTYFDLNITEIHFYHNMVFIKKGSNKEGSNMVFDNQWPK